MVEFRMRSDRELCRVCHGNGVVKIPGGVSQCDHCEGLCWEPVAPPADNAALVARLRTALTWLGCVSLSARGNKSADQLARTAARAAMLDAIDALSAHPPAEE